MYMHTHLHHHHNPFLILLSVGVAAFASYTALDLVNCVTTTKGKWKWPWLAGGAIAMGVGIWSMHFVGMLAFHVPGLEIYYDLPLLLLSIVVAILSSALALYVVSYLQPTVMTYVAGSLTMGFAIAGMHYIGIWSMRMSASIIWDKLFVVLSIGVAVTASYLALFIAFRLRNKKAFEGYADRCFGGLLMGIAISGMHYTAMGAMQLIPDSSHVVINPNDLLASDGVAAGVLIATVLILGLALTGTSIERSLIKKTILNETLQASIKSRDDFFSVISHELRTPLTSIKMQNELIVRSILKKQVDETKILTMLEKSGKHIDRINRLVDDFLDVSRMSSGKLSLQRENFDIVLLINEVIDRHRPFLDEAGCEVFFQNNSSIIGCWDKFRIEQVITNLLTNAAKYAPGSPVNISVAEINKCIQIRVKDQGIGIVEEDQQRIFQRFERVLGNEDKRGLGLGLYITHEILQMHHGKISVNSGLNRGAEFIVELPLSPT